MIGTMAIVLTFECTLNKKCIHVAFGVLGGVLFPAIITLQNFPTVGLSLRRT